MDATIYGYDYTVSLIDMCYCMRGAVRVGWFAKALDDECHATTCFEQQKHRFSLWGVSCELLYTCSPIKPWEGTCLALHDPEPEVSSTRLSLRRIQPSHPSEAPSRYGKTVYKRQFPRYQVSNSIVLKAFRRRSISKQVLVIQLYPSYLTGKHERGRRGHWLQFSRWRWVRNNRDSAFWSW
jgi:hypothetical protein